MKRLLFIILLSSCMKIEHHGQVSQKTCLDEWATEGQYSYLEFTIPQNGVGTLDPYATLTGASSQGLTWVFTSQSGDNDFELTVYDQYYQDFNSGIPNDGGFFAMWEADHELEFEEAGVLRVRKYNYFTSDESVCLHFTKGLIDNSEK